MKELLGRLIGCFGPSGREDAVRQVVGAELEAMGEHPRADPLGNLVAVRPARSGRGRRILLAAHMDEIGLMVTHVDEKGFARFAPVGGHSPQVLVGQRVRFADGTVGSVGAEHRDDPKDLKLEHLFIDCGGPADAVRTGEMCVLDRGLEAEGERWIGKAMDDRAGCLVLLEVARALKDSPHEVHFAFTVQEEVGLRGARAAGFAAEPDLAVAVDVTATGDTPKARTMDVALGRGAAVKVRDSSLIAHPRVVGWLTAAGERRGIPYQMEVLEFGGTDAGAIHTTQAGVPSGCVSIPTRYVHTPAEMVDAGDLRACVDLLVEALSAPVA